MMSFPKPTTRTISCLMVLLIIATPVVAQTSETSSVNEYLQGKIDGQRDGKSSSEILWTLVGCLLGPVGVLVGYLVTPTVPGERLIGKSPEYVQGYTEGYQKKGREQNALWAGMGCLVSTIGTCLYYLIVLAEASSYSY